MFDNINIQQLASAFLVLFAIIDIVGAVPIIISLREKGMDVNARKTATLSAIVLFAFFYAGDMLLRLFQVDKSSFAIAGAMVLFCLAIEMILDIEIFKNNGPSKRSAIVPLVFPLIAGVGAFTTLLSLRGEYADINILLALLLNMIVVFVVLQMTERIQRIVSTTVIYIIRKFFGFILLAMAARMFTVNLTQLIHQI
ncbi:MAG: MarC family protein [Bacteroidales bacterium]|nr:MarC family protein [Bacteroidales bacterium]